MKQYLHMLRCTTCKSYVTEVTQGSQNPIMRLWCSCLNDQNHVGTTEVFDTTPVKELRPWDEGAPCPDDTNGDGNCQYCSGIETKRIHELRAKHQVSNLSIEMAEFILGLDEGISHLVSDDPDHPCLPECIPCRLLAINGKLSRS